MGEAVRSGHERPLAATALSSGAAETAAELVATGSVEITVGHLSELPSAAPLLPAGCCAYVPSLPGQSLDTTLAALAAIREAGLDPVPHLAARSIRSEPALSHFLRRAAGDFGVHRVLVIGGDRDGGGVYRDSADLLRSGVLAGAGVREVGLAGFPDGHPHGEDGFALLADKLALAAAQDAAPYIVTQFSFDPDAIHRFCSELAQRFPEVGVYVGIPGPTDPVALLRYARRCGVKASRRALQSLGRSVARLAWGGDPDDQLEALARFCAPRPGLGVVGIHLYSFGGVERSARWMRCALQRSSQSGAAPRTP